MKYLSFASILLLVLLSNSACVGKDDPVVPEPQWKEVKEDPDETPVHETESMTIKIIAGGKTFSSEIEDSETGRAFIAKLPLTLEMSDLNGNEKYCYGVELPSADRRFDSISSGDLMLYSGECIVLFYGNAGGYSYTRIGRLTGTEGLADALGKGKITVTFEKQ